MERDKLNRIWQQYRQSGTVPPEAAKLLSQNAAGAINIYQEFEMRSRYVDTQRDTSRLGGTVQLHSHTFYEIVCCYQGSIQYLLGTNRYRIGVGDIVIIPPGIGHRPLLTPNMPQSYDRYVIWLSKEFVEDLHSLSRPVFQSENPKASLLRTHGAQWDFLRRSFAEGVTEAERQAPGWEAAVMGNTLLLLVRIQRMLIDARTQPGAEEPELLEQVLDYVERHMGEKITLGGTARQFLVSESTISQLFRQRMGVSFYHCVTQRRLIEAKARIDAGDALEEVARTVGFGDYSSFYRAFKNEYGISPTQYRQM